MIRIKFGFDSPSGFRGEEKLWMDGRTPDHGHPISSPCEPNGSGELIKPAKYINLQSNNVNIIDENIFFYDYDLP